MNIDYLGKRISISTLKRILVDVIPQFGEILGLFWALFRPSEVVKGILGVQLA